MDSKFLSVDLGGAFFEVGGAQDKPNLCRFHEQIAGVTCRDSSAAEVLDRASGDCPGTTTSASGSLCSSSARRDGSCRGTYSPAHLCAPLSQGIAAEPPQHPSTALLAFGLRVCTRGCYRRPSSKKTAAFGPSCFPRPDGAC